MGKLTMFFGFVWLITCLGGGMMMGFVPIASTELTADITDADTTIPVEDTTGFPEPGIIVIDSERIAYSSTSAASFTGNLARPMERGTGGTDAEAHTEGTTVRMVESAMMNNSIDYNLAVISDAAGAQAFLSIPIAVFDILFSFARSPFGFLGTDLQIITAIWAICFLGMIVSFFISIAGGRRV